MSTEMLVKYHWEELFDHLISLTLEFIIIAPKYFLKITGTLYEETTNSDNTLPTHTHTHTQKQEKNSL